MFNKAAIATMLGALAALGPVSSSPNYGVAGLREPAAQGAAMWTWRCSRGTTQRALHLAQLPLG